MSYTPVRRKDKEITDPIWINNILKRGQYMSLAMIDLEGNPYLVTTSYGYDNNCLYLHGAPEGKKFEILSKNPLVSFQVVLDTELVTSPEPSKYTWKYRSITGSGRIHTLQTLEEKNQAMQILMKQYKGPSISFENDPLFLWIACIKIEHITGKNSLHSLET